MTHGYRRVTISRRRRFRNGIQQPEGGFMNLRVRATLSVIASLLLLPALTGTARATSAGGAGCRARTCPAVLPSSSWAIRRAGRPRPGRSIGDVLFLTSRPGPRPTRPDAGRVNDRIGRYLLGLSHRPAIHLHPGVSGERVHRESGAPIGGASPEAAQDHDGHRTLEASLSGAARAQRAHHVPRFTGVRRRRVSDASAKPRQYGGKTIWGKQDQHPCDGDGQARLSPVPDRMDRFHRDQSEESARMRRASTRAATNWSMSAFTRTRSMSWV